MGGWTRLLLSLPDHSFFLELTLISIMRVLPDIYHINCRVVGAYLPSIAGWVGAYLPLADGAYFVVGST
jgi:hypothetical protein